MTRLLYRTALALLLTANAAGLAVQTAHGGGLPPLIGCVSLAYIGLVVLGYAFGAAFHVGRADACRWSRRRALGTYSHAARTAAVRTAAPAELTAPGRHAAAVAAVMAAPLADTQPMPVVEATVPMPVIEITRAMPTWSFNGTRVVEEVGR